MVGERAGRQRLLRVVAPGAPSYGSGFRRVLAEGGVADLAVLLPCRLDRGDPDVVAFLARPRLVGRQRRVGKAPHEQVERQVGAPEHGFEPAGFALLEPDIRQGQGAEAESAGAAGRALFEQERGGAAGHQVEVALVHFDEEVRAVEMALQRRADIFQHRPGRSGFVGRQLGAGGQVEPARPGRRQFGEQAGGELVDRIRRGAVEQRIGGARRRGAEGAAQRQGVGIAVAPHRLPVAPRLFQPLELLAQPGNRLDILRLFFHRLFSEQLFSARSAGPLAGEAVGQAAR